MISGQTLIAFAGDSQVVGSRTLDAYTGLGALYAVLNSLTTGSALCDDQYPVGVEIVHKVMVFGAKVACISCTASDAITQNSSAPGASADLHRNFV